MCVRVCIYVCVCVSCVHASPERDEMTKHAHVPQVGEELRNRRRRAVSVRMYAGKGKVVDY